MISLGQLTGFMRGADCVGKVAFDTYAAAEQEIGRLIARRAHRPEHGVLNAYLCRACARWHVGHLRLKAPATKSRRRLKAPATKSRGDKAPRD